MSNFKSNNIHFNTFSKIILGMIFVLTFINLQIGLKVFLDPAPFPSSYWDIRWAFIYGFSFLLIGLLFIFSREKILFFISIMGLALSFLIPIFTINSGPAFLMFFLISIIAFGLGESILYFIMGKTVVDKFLVFLFSILIGLGIIMILVMIQGFLNAFTSLVTWIGIAILIILFVIPKLKKWFYSIRVIFYQIRTSLKNTGQFPLFALVFSVFVILWIPSWFIALSPPMRYDEMTYHLTAPLLYLERGGIVIYPEGGMTAWMHYAEMLYTLAIQTAGLTLPRIFHFFMGGLSVLGTFIFSRRLFGNKTGLIAAILLFSVPVLGYESATAYIDFFVTAYTTAVGLAFLLYWQEKNPRWLLIAGFLGGIGLGVKLTAGPMLLIMLAFLLLLMLLNKKNEVDFGWFFLCVFMILTLALPWLIRDNIWTGDPFFPYGKMFLNKMTLTSNPSAGIVESGLIERLSKYIVYPIELVFNSNRYYHEAPGGMASILPLMAIPVFIFSPLLSKHKKIIGLILFTSSIITVWLMILINSALLRYALPIFPWLAICAAMNIDSVFRDFQLRKRSVLLIILLFTGLIYLFSTRLPLIVRIYDNMPQRFPINFLLGRETRDEFLSRNLAVYDAYQFIDAQENGPHRVLSIGNEFRLYTQSRIDGIYDVAKTHNIVSSAENYVSLTKSLVDAGYDFLLVNQPEIDYRPWKYRDPYPILQNSGFYDLFCELVFANKGIYVYQLSKNEISRPETKNLIQNPGFEEKFSGTTPIDWDIGGYVRISDEGFEGDYSLLIGAPNSPDGFGYAQQNINVIGGEIYTLGYWLSSDEPSVFLMRVQWFDESGILISTDERWKNVDQDWHWNVLYSTAPDRAQSATIVASWGGEVNGYVDNICFAKGQKCPITNEDKSKN